MLIDDPEALKSWLTSYLEPLCEADPEALAKYVMALIKKEKPEEELRTICHDQLEVFLQKETKPFVSVFFTKLKDKTYLEEVSSTANEQPPPAPSAGVVSSANDTTSSPAPEENTDSTSPNKKSKSRLNNEPTKRRSRSRSRSPRRRQEDSRSLNRGAGRNPRDGNREDHRGRRGGPSNSSSISRPGRRDGWDTGNNAYRPNHRRSSRSRSRSPPNNIRGNMSRSRSRSPRRQEGRSRSNDKDNGHLNKRKHSTSPSPDNAANSSEPSKRRCRDYETQGFCMRGELCQFDHGSEPIILDTTSQSMFSLPANGAPLLPTPGPTAAANWAEPYNPEAPAMDSGHHQGANGRRGPPPPRMMPSHPINAPGQFHPGAPPLGFFPRGPPPPRGMVPFNPNHGPPGHNNYNQGRPRELAVIQPQDTENTERPQMDNRQQFEGHQGMMMRGRGRGRGRGFGRGGRVGFGGRRQPDQPDKCTLEVRKLPAELNTISHLNQHFSKFGTIVNLQVCFEGDREAALIQFASHAEAQAAHRSTEAVLNNRFIKVFWHSKTEQQNNPNPVQEGNPEDQNSTEEGQAEKRIPVKDRLSALPASGDENKNKRTVFNPNLLKKSNMVSDQKVSSAPGGDVVHPIVKMKSEQKKENMLRKMEMQKKHQELMSSYMQQQKLLFNKIAVAKSDVEKKKIKEEILNVSSRLKTLETLMKKDAQELKQLLGGHGHAVAPKVVITADKAEVIKKEVPVAIDELPSEKELLDRELDLYQKLRDESND